jgi:hypothetical protein
MEGMINCDLVRNSSYSQQNRSDVCAADLFHDQKFVLASENQLQFRTAFGAGRVRITNGYRATPTTHLVCINYSHRLANLAPVLALDSALSEPSLRP